MTFRRKIVALISVVLPVLTSCRAISSFLNKDEVVARVGTESLYRSELGRVLPKGLAPEDSARLALRYINSWASDRVYLKMAEQQLSKAEKDVTKELEDYRVSLLKFRYEQLYVNERLDTAVTQENVEEYYMAHQDKFILERPIVKARFLNIAGDSPMLNVIRRKMNSSQAEDLVEADSLAFSSATLFTTWSGGWIDVSVLAGEYGTDYRDILSRMDRGWIEMADTAGQVRLAYVAEMVQRGKVAPIEFCTEKIKDMIISARRQELITNLERDLLVDARENGQFIIY